MSKKNRNKKYVYFVEGQNEQNMVNAIKNTHLISGKVKVFNVLEKTINKSILRTFDYNTNIILVIDTDVEDKKCLEKLDENLKILKKSKHIESTILITQVKNFEDELIRSCDIKRVIDFTKSKSNKDFKSDFNSIGSSLNSKLKYYSFDISKFWSEKPRGIYENLENMASEIKIF